jgi:hypothetical protein
MVIEEWVRARIGLGAMLSGWAFGAQRCCALTGLGLGRVWLKGHSHLGNTLIRPRELRVTLC